MEIDPNIFSIYQNLMDAGWITSFEWSDGGKGLAMEWTDKGYKGLSALKLAFSDLDAKSFSAEDWKTLLWLVETHAS